MTRVCGWLAGCGGAGQIDGVPFGVLNLKPLNLPGRQASSRNASGHRAVERSADLDDDFDPRASSQPAVSSSAKPKAVVQAKAAPVVDLLSMDAPATVPTLPAPTGVASFDPFGAGGGGNDFNPRGNSSDPFAPTSSFDVVKPKPVPGFGANTLTAEELAAQVGAVSFAPRPQLTYGGPSMTATPSSPAPADFSGFQVARTGPSTPDVEKATASLVNLNNLLDDSPASKQQAAFKPVYTDNRSLEEMKATSRVSQDDYTHHKTGSPTSSLFREPLTVAAAAVVPMPWSCCLQSSQPAKPVFIDRPAPAFGPGPGAMGMGGPPRPGGFPQGPPMAGGGFGGAPAFGAFPQQQPRPMGFGPPTGMMQQQQPGGFPMAGNGFGQPMQMQGGGFGALPSAAPRGMMMAFPPRPPPSNDPFQGLGL